MVSAGRSKPVALNEITPLIGSSRLLQQNPPIADIATARYSRREFGLRIVVTEEHQ
jgi:hypothetical protein